MAVTLYDQMRSPGRKFLLAGRGGLNLTHAEPLDRFLDRYGAAREALAPAIAGFDPAALRAWSAGLGQPTFVGSSQRVFPEAFRATPLLRAWLARLARPRRGVQARPSLARLGSGGRAALRDAGQGRSRRTHGATLLALGGASWPRLGSDGDWVEILRDQGIPVAPLRPANCGFVAELVPGVPRPLRRPAAQAHRRQFRRAEPCAAKR